VSKDFIPSIGLSSAEAERLLIEWGPNELEEKTKPKVSTDAVIITLHQSNEMLIE